MPDTSAENFTIRVPPSVARQISRTRISGQTLERAFPISIEGTGATMTLGRKETGFTQFMLNTLDTRVRTALLRGDTTEEVMKNAAKQKAQEKIEEEMGDKLKGFFNR